MYDGESGGKVGRYLWHSEPLAQRLELVLWSQAF